MGQGLLSEQRACVAERGQDERSDAAQGRTVGRREARQSVEAGDCRRSIRTRCGKRRGASSTAGPAKAMSYDCERRCAAAILSLGASAALSGIPLRETLLALAVVVVSLTPARADLRVCNKTKVLINFAVGVNGGADFSTEGWWTVTPGSCATPIRGALTGRFVYLYATDIDAADVLKGAVSMCVDRSKFKVVRHCGLLAARFAGGRFRRDRHARCRGLDDVPDRRRQVVGLAAVLHRVEIVLGQYVLQQAEEIARGQRPGAIEQIGRGARRLRRAACGPPTAVDQRKRRGARRRRRRFGFV